MIIDLSAYEGIDVEVDVEVDIDGDQVDNEAFCADNNADPRANFDLVPDTAVSVVFD